MKEASTKKIQGRSLRARPVEAAMMEGVKAEGKIYFLGVIVASEVNGVQIELRLYSVILHLPPL